MIKKLIFGGMAFSLLALNANAQTKNLQDFPEANTTGEASSVEARTQLTDQKVEVAGDLSYYYDENNARITSELNTLLGAGSFDTLSLYSYTVKEKTTTSSYWQRCFQGFPNTDDLTLNSVDFVAQSLKPGGGDITVKVMDKNFGELASETFDIGSTYGFKSVTFTTPVTYNDTMYIAFDMPTLADSFVIAQSHSIWEGYDFGPSGIFNSGLPFDGSAAILAYDSNYTSILGLIREGFDFFIYPNFTYDVPADFTATTTIVENPTFTNCLTEAITFENIANKSHITNPILNYFEWDRLANGGGSPYTDYNFDDGSTGNFVQAHSTVYSYSTIGNYNVTAYAIIAPWTQAPKVDSSEFTIEVIDCTVSINEVENNSSVSVYPNPVKNIINFEIDAANSILTVVDITGKTVMTEQLNARLNSVNVANLTNGFYIYKLTSSNGDVATGNFVVSK